MEIKLIHDQENLSRLLEMVCFSDGTRNSNKKVSDYFKHIICSMYVLIIICLPSKGYHGIFREKE